MSDEKRAELGLIEKAFLIGVGAASLAKEKAEELAEELIQRGSLNRDEADDFVGQLMNDAKEAGRNAQDNVTRGAERAIAGVGLASAKDVEELRAELAEIRAVLEELRPKVGAAGTGASGTEYIP